MVRSNKKSELKNNETANTINNHFRSAVANLALDNWNHHSLSSTQGFHKTILSNSIKTTLVSKTLKENVSVRNFSFQPVSIKMSGKLFEYWKNNKAVGGGVIPVHILKENEFAQCNISSQDVSKFTYLTLDKYISDEKCIKATPYIVSINSLVRYNYSNYNIYKFTINIFSIIALGNNIPSCEK